MDKYIEPLDSIFHALADPTRRAVVQRLVKGPAPVKELAAPYDMALPSFMKHISVLEQAGLIASQKQDVCAPARLIPTNWRQQKNGSSNSVPSGQAALTISTLY